MAKGTGAVVFLAIIAVAGLGLSGYMFTMDLIQGKNEEYELVALWEDLKQNKVDNPSYNTDSNFLIEFDDNIIFNPTYVNNISNTRFGFNVAGMYKISLKVLFNGLIADQTCWIYIRRNNTAIGYFTRIDMGNPVESQFYQVDATIYINATTDVYYEINPYSSWDFWHVGPTLADFNHLSIEYLGI